MVLRWNEMAWWLGEGATKMYLGEAGNLSYHTNWQIQAVRYGSDVLVVCRCTGEEHVVPAEAILEGFEGFRPDLKDGMTLKQAMEEGVVYNYALQPMM